MPGLSFSTIDYEAQGTAAGEELANCINERYDGKAEVLFAESAPGTAGKEELRDAPSRRRSPPAPRTPRSSRPSRSATAPPHRPTSATRSRATPTSPRSSARTTRARSAPIGAFKAAGKDLPCITEAGGNEETLAAVESGDIYAVVALQFAADMAQSFDALTAMIDDPEATGVQLTVPQEVVKASS